MCSESHLHFDYVRLAWDSGFCFQEDNAKAAFDFNVLGLLDLEKVVKERDIAAVEKNITTILHFKLDEDLSKVLEPNFVKVFRLSQLAIQYLRFCKKYLDNTVIILKKDLSVLKDEYTHLENFVTELKTNHENLLKQNKDLKEAFKSVNQIASYKCNECSKAFSTEEYLLAHVKRRHDTEDLLQTESDRLQMEIKELKQRLNNTEKYIQYEKETAEPNNDAVFARTSLAMPAEKIQEKFDQLKEHIEKELSLLRDEAFYKNIYEKTFRDFFEKFQSPKKVFVEQGSGDYVQRSESSTQTAVPEVKEAEAEVVMPVPKPRLIVEDKRDDFKDVEDRLKLEVEQKQEQLQSVFEEKLAGGFQRLETQMNSFMQKFSEIELKQQEEAKAKLQASLNDNLIFKLPQTPTRIMPQVTQTRYIKGPVNINTDSSDDSETIPSPKRTPVKVVQVLSRNNSIRTSVDRSRDVKEAPRIVIKTKKPQVEQKNAIDNIVPENKASLKTFTDVDVIKRHIDIVDDSKLQSKLELSKKFAATTSETTSSVESDDSDDSCEGKLNAGKIKSTFYNTSEDEDKVKHIKPIPSATSTLAQRSITSLKNASYDDEVMDGLKTELQQLFELKLKELGVAPHWKGLPDKTYKHVHGIVLHQGSLAKKTMLNYTKIREDITNALARETKSYENKGTMSIKSPKKRMHSNRKKRELTSVRKPSVEQPTTTNIQHHPPESTTNNKPENNTVHAFDNTSDSIESLESIQNVPKTVDESNTILHQTVTNKSVLKTNTQAVSNKKKVLFNLDSDDSVKEIKESSRAERVSTTSVPSSLLDANINKGSDNKENLDVKSLKKDEEGSDWDISDIIT